MANLDSIIAYSVNYSIANGILQFYNDYERVDFADQIESYKQRFTWNEFIHQLENIIS